MIVAAAIFALIATRPLTVTLSSADPWVDGTKLTMSWNGTNYQCTVQQKQCTVTVTNFDDNAGTYLYLFPEGGTRSQGTWWFCDCGTCQEHILARVVNVGGGPKLCGSAPPVEQPPGRLTAPAKIKAQSSKSKQPRAKKPKRGRKEKR